MAKNQEIPLDKFMKALFKKSVHDKKALLKQK